MEEIHFIHKLCAFRLLSLPFAFRSYHPFSRQCANDGAGKPIYGLCVTVTDVFSGLERFRFNFTHSLQQNRSGYKRSLKVKFPTHFTHWRLHFQKSA